MISPVSASPEKRGDTAFGPHAYEDKTLPIEPASQPETFVFEENTQFLINYHTEK